MYTIPLADGTKLKHLELNGNNYISEAAIEDSVFEGNIDTVKISDGSTTETFTDIRLMSNIVRDGRSWFVLGEKSAQQKAMEQMEKLYTTTADSITDVQMALAEVYEMILGGM